MEIEKIYKELKESLGVDDETETVVLFLLIPCDAGTSEEISELVSAAIKKLEKQDKRIHGTASLTLFGKRMSG